MIIDTLASVRVYRCNREYRIHKNLGISNKRF